MTILKNNFKDYNKNIPLFCSKEQINLMNSMSLYKCDNLPQPHSLVLETQLNPLVCIFFHYIYLPSSDACQCLCVFTSINNYSKLWRHWLFSYTNSWGFWVSFLFTDEINECMQFLFNYFFVKYVRFEKQSLAKFIFVLTWHVYK